MRVGFITDLSESDFKFAAKWKIPCVEAMFSGDLGALDRFDDVKGYMDRYGVEFSMLALFGRDHISDDQEERAKNLKDAKALVDMCQEIGAPYFVTGAGEVGDRNVDENIDRAVEFFGDLVDYARDRAVKVLLYNCHWSNFAFSPESWAKILPKIPDLGLKYDPSHPFYDGRDYLREMRDWGKRIYHFHAKGGLEIAGERLEDPPAGLDQIDWGSVMAVLYHHRYDGDINIEPHAPIWRRELRYQGILLARRHLMQFIVEEV